MFKSIDDNVLLLSVGFLKQKEYWENKLSGDIADTEICFDYRYRGIQAKKENIKRREIVFSHDIFGRLMKLSKQSDLSLYILLLAALKSFIYRYTGNKDISVISPINQLKITEETINNFLFIRDEVDGDITFKELIFKIKQTTLEAYNNQDYPMGKFIEYLFDTLPGDKFKSNILCSLNTLHSERNINELAGKLSFLFAKEASLLKCNILYDPGAYEPYYVEQISKHFTGVLGNALEDVDIKISEISFLSEEEKQRLLIDFNDTGAAYPGNKTIHGIFEDQAAKTPDHIALGGLVFPHQAPADAGVVYGEVPGSGNQYLTYRALDERAGGLARRLMERGCGSGVIAAVMTDPVIEMMIAIIAVLKTGACYLPIDPINPAGRIRYLLADSETKLLLTHSLMSDKVDFNGQRLDINTGEVGEVLETGKREQRGEPGDPAYIIYTSGTTGHPKGVPVKHENLVNYVTWFSSAACVTVSDKTILTSSFGFDLGYTSIYSSLLKGAQLHILPREFYMLPAALLDYMNTRGISYLKMTPSFFAIVVSDSYFSEENTGTLRLVVLGGEPIYAADVEKAYRICNHLRIMNHYGPTEVTIGCIARFVENHELETYKARPTIGKPIFNTNVYILDECLHVLPVGAAGELYLSGAGVAGGYLNRPELTAEKFVSISYKSYRTYRTYSSKKIYKTGDLARWLPDGNIEFLGRRDHQVKVRGFRIELGEIESKLLQHTSIKETVVLAKENEKGDKYLCVYFVPSMQSGIKSSRRSTVSNDKENEVNIPGIRSFLTGELPDYMIPSCFIPIHHIPLTANGKLDSRALPEPQVLESPGEHIVPANRTELKLAELWKELLGIDRINVNDDFFGLGGNSLNAIIMISRIRKLFNVHLPLREIFKMPTIRGLSDYIRSKEEDPWISIDPVEEKEYYAAASAQKRLYTLQRLDLRSTAYNMPQMEVVEGKIDRNKLENTFLKLIERHESFRTGFEMIGEEPVQRIQYEAEFEIEYYDQELSTVSNFIRPFDISQAPLLRVGLIKEAGEQHILMVDMHHIIADGISRSILIKEFMAFYGGEDLPPLRLQYKDYSEWQNSDLQKKKQLKVQAYWLKQFEGELPVLALPTDYPRSGIPNFEGRKAGWGIGVKDTRALRELALEEGTTMYMVLFAIYYVFLSKITNQEDIIVGTPTIGRLHTDLEPLVGMFVSTLALRNYPAAEKTFKAFLYEVKQNALEAFENQDYSLEQLVDRVAKDRNLGEYPLFDVMFTFANVEYPQLEIPGLKLAPYFPENEIAKFDLHFYVHEREQLAITCEYRSSLFNKDTIERFFSYFQDVMHTVLKEKEVKLKDIALSHDLLAARSVTFEKGFNF